MTHAAEVAVLLNNELGEGVLWCDREQALYWTDICASTLWRYRVEHGALDHWRLPERLASFALCEADGWLLLGLASHLAFFQPASQTLVTITEVEAGLPTRVNDGACDRDGRFVFGTLHEPTDDAPREPIGGYYRLNRDLSLERLPLPDVAISNSIAFSPDGERMYFCDSVSPVIQCCDYGERCGAPTVFATIDLSGGEPDGSVVDRDGGLWNAQWGLGRVVRYHPDGRLDRVIDVPASQPTRAVFGGAQLDTLYITSARLGLSANAITAQPFAGALFAVRVDVCGLPEPRFAGPPAHVIAAGSSHQH
ncbi:SMP-30/gluconolactonase/LRE family protein [Dyella solisilvae]|uniref:SMP-30/gluconolactonase/LRE family protein n=1 Tax=Dyella solisilvae TaxID=1920168 RepID=A0A370K7Y1_9GAMM|nr:SMP-30/gluconolactonase/LRE family protein [Dyella solisilvae]RDI98743.1 SMP-30/gluconolactonase/LRE family protein [Dyella solisilvae]